MKKNMGSIDKVIRIGLALIVAALYFAGFISGIVATVLFILATIFIITSFIGVCPLYLPFGISTKPKSKNNQ